VSGDVRLTIRGIQEAQRANLRIINAMKPSGGLGRAIQYALGALHRRAVYNTPWDTGSLRASHRIEWNGGYRGRIYIDPGATNPRSSQRPAEYGPRLHAQGKIPGIRGGVRAFYTYTVEAFGEQIARDAIRIVVKEAGL
jgi:hypothetical protein